MLKGVEPPPMARHILCLLKSYFANVEVEAGKGGGLFRRAQLDGGTWNLG